MSTTHNTHGTFPRSKRFLEPAANEVPGPGTYNPLIHSPDQMYKRGAMLEKAGRFHEQVEGPDTFGKYDSRDVGSKENRRPPTSSVATTSSRIQMDDKLRLQGVHDKEMAKLAAKLAKSEAGREEMLKEKTESRAELSVLKQENRNLNSQLTKTTTSLTKHTTLIPLLQKKVEELNTSHSTSSKRKDSELVSLQTSLASTSTQLEEVEYQLTISTQESSLRRTLIADLHSSTTGLLSNQYSKITPTEFTSLEKSHHVAQLRILRLERQLSDRLAQVTALATFANDTESQLSLSMSEMESLRSECHWRATEEKRRREEDLEAKVREKEWRRRTRATERDVHSLKDDLRLAKEARWDQEVETITLRNELKELEEEFEIIEGELEIATESEIPRLEEEINALSTTISSTKEVLYRTERSLRDLSTSSRENENRMEGEIEELSRRLGERERECVKSAEEKKRLIGLLGGARSAEEGLREELESAHTQLTHLHTRQRAEQSSSRTIDELARRNAAAEADVRELEELNTQLMSNGNPNAKIRHLANLREQLGESRRLHLATTSALASSKAEIASLQSELSAYRSVPSTSTSSHLSTSAFPLPPNYSRSKVSRPDLGDVFATSPNQGGGSPLEALQVGGWKSSTSSSSSRLSLNLPGIAETSDYLYSNSTDLIRQQDEAEQEEEERMREMSIHRRAGLAMQDLEGGIEGGRMCSTPPGSPGGGVRMKGKMRVRDLY